MYSVRKLKRSELTSPGIFRQVYEIVVKLFFAKYDQTLQWMDLYQQMQTTDVFVVSKDFNEIVGMCICSYVSILVSKRAIIDLVYIKEDHRSKGLATQLIHYVGDYLKDIDIDCVELNVDKDNVNAIKLYKRCTFEEVDSLIMRKIYRYWERNE